MRNLIRNTVLSTLGIFKSITNGVHILNSHYIGREDLPAAIFHDLLIKLSKQADLLKFEDAVELIATKNVNKIKAIAFSFDDGFEECYTKIAPVLNDFNTNAAFFVNPGFIDGNESYINNFQQNKVHVNKKPMTWEQLKGLHQQGFIIGNHTKDHVKLKELNHEELITQIVNSKKLIEEKINGNCDYFAWTYGGMNDIDKNALELALNNHKYIFSCDNYTQYHSLNNTQIINRRHIEGDWPINHINYFLSKGKHF